MAKFVNIDGLKPIKVFLSAYAEEPILVYKKEDIDRRTAADVAPVVHGKWLFVNPPTEIIDWEECSVCGYANYNFSHYKYCPNCGAKMDEVAK